MNKLLKCRWNLVVCAIVSAAASIPAVDSSSEIAPPSAIFEALALNGDLPSPARPKYLSPTELTPSPDGRWLYVAEQTAKRIDVIDVTAKIVTQRFRLPDEVTGVAVSPDGLSLYATCSSERWPAGKVCIINVLSGKVVATVAAGFGVRAPVITPDGNTLFVCNRFGNSVSVIDVSTRRETARIEMVREPFCAAITPDGKTLAVGNFLTADRSVDSAFFSCKISLIDIAGRTMDTVRLRRGSHSVSGITVSPDGKFAFATHMIGFNHIIGTTVERGHLHRNMLSVIDIANRKTVNEVCLDQSLKGMAEPWGVRCTDDGRFMAITHAGANELSIIRYPALMDTVQKRTDQGESMLFDFMEMPDIRKRVEVSGRCPRALAIIGTQAFVAGYYNDSFPAVEVYDLSLETNRLSSRIELDQPSPVTGRRRGEALFCDASLCFQKWQSCNSCHPFTRPDGGNWILGGGAMVAPKNTKSMVYGWWTPPMTWTGRRGTAQQGIIAGIELELFRVPTTDLTLPMDTFFMYMKPAASPLLDKGKLSAAAVRGRELFRSEALGCTGCHSGTLFCDLSTHDTKIPDVFDAATNWNTPSLVEAWRTAPYGHLGSIPGVREIIETYMLKEGSGTPDAGALNDLAEYVRSL